MGKVDFILCTEMRNEFKLNKATNLQGIWRQKNLKPSETLRNQNP